MTRCHHGQLIATCRECPHAWMEPCGSNEGTDRCWLCGKPRAERPHLHADPLRPIETDDEPAVADLAFMAATGRPPRLRASGAPVGCVLLLLAVAAGVVAGYLLGVTR